MKKIFLFLFLALLANISEAQFIRKINVGVDPTGCSDGTLYYQVNTKEIWGCVNGTPINLTIISAEESNGIRYAGNFAGATIGAKIVAAIADLPATGGTISAIGLEGGTISQDMWNGTTKPITLLLGCGTYTITAAQVVTVYSQVIGLGDCTLWNYTPTTGTDWTFDFPNGDSTVGAGLYNMQLVGPGGAEAAKGLVIGGTDGARGFTLKNVRISDYGTAVEYANNAWITSFSNFVIRDSETLLNIPAGLTNTGENLSFRDGSFADATTFGSDVVVDLEIADVTFDAVSFDNAQLVQSNGVIRGSNLHFENPSQNITDPFFSCTAGKTFFDNLEVLQGQSAGDMPTDLFSFTDCTMAIHGATVYSNATVTNFVKRQVGGLGNLNMKGLASITGVTNSYNSNTVLMTGVGDFFGTVPITMQNATSATAKIDVSTANLFSIARGATNALTVDGVGDVGIGLGTTAASTKLDVNGSFRTTQSTVTFSATPAFNAALGNSFAIVLTDNVTSCTITNPFAGQKITLIVKQSAGGSNTFACANLKGLMTISGTANSINVQEFIYYGTETDWFAISSGVTGMTP